MAQWKGTRLVSMRMQVQSLASLSRLRIQLCCELWCRSQTRLGVGQQLVAPILWPLAWELPYAMDAALTSKKRHENKTSQTIIALLTSSTTCTCTNIPQLMTRCLGESGLRVFTNHISKNMTCKNFHTMFFHFVSNPSPHIWRLLKDKLILGRKKVKSSLHLSLTENKQ